MCEPHIGELSEKEDKRMGWCLLKAQKVFCGMFLCLSWMARNVLNKVLLPLTLWHCSLINTDILRELPVYYDQVPIFFLFFFFASHINSRKGKRLAWALPKQWRDAFTYYYQSKWRNCRPDGCILSIQLKKCLVNRDKWSEMAEHFLAI